MSMVLGIAPVNPMHGSDVARAVALSHVTTNMRLLGMMSLNFDPVIAASAKRRLREIEN